MTQSPGRRLYPREFPHLRVTSQPRVGLAESRQLFYSNECLVRQNCVERQATMSLAQNQAITITPHRVRRIEAKEGVVQNAQDFNQRERRADMASAIHLDHLHNQPPKFFRTFI